MDASAVRIETKATRSVQILECLAMVATMVDFMIERLVKKRRPIMGIGLVRLLAICDVDTIEDTISYTIRLVYL